MLKVYGGWGADVLEALERETRFDYLTHHLTINKVYWNLNANGKYSCRVPIYSPFMEGAPFSECHAASLRHSHAGEPILSVPLPSCPS